jgi:hypothetical protein
MAWEKWDLTAVVDNYTDANGQAKQANKNIGSLMIDWENRKIFGELERSFNPAGAPPAKDKEGKNKVKYCIINAFKQKPKDGGNNSSYQAPNPVLADDIPF